VGNEKKSKKEQVLRQRVLKKFTTGIILPRSVDQQQKVSSTSQISQHVHRKRKQEQNTEDNLPQNQ